MEWNGRRRQAVLWCWINISNLYGCNDNDGTPHHTLPYPTIADPIPFPMHRMVIIILSPVELNGWGEQIKRVVGSNCHGCPRPPAPPCPFLFHWGLAISELSKHNRFGIRNRFSAPPTPPPTAFVSILQELEVLKWRGISSALYEEWGWWFWESISGHNLTHLILLKLFSWSSSSSILQLMRCSSGIGKTVAHRILLCV